MVVLGVALAITGLVILSQSASASPPTSTMPKGTAPQFDQFHPISRSLWVTQLVVKAPIGQALAAPTKSFVIMITAKGFGTNASVVVNQGDSVKITFIMDASQIANTSPANHHVITIDGYNIDTADINPTHPNATVTFTANQLGNFFIYCDTDECPVHALMVSGTLEVDAAAPTTTTSTATTTTSTTTTSTSTTSTTTTSTSTTTTSTVPEFPSSVLAMLALIGMVTVAILSRRTTPRPAGLGGP